MYLPLMVDLFLTFLGYVGASAPRRTTRASNPSLTNTQNNIPGKKASSISTKDLKRLNKIAGEAWKIDPPVVDHLEVDFFSNLSESVVDPADLEVAKVDDPKSSEVDTPASELVIDDPKSSDVDPPTLEVAEVDASEVDPPFLEVVDPKSLEVVDPTEVVDSFFRHIFRGR